MTEILVTGGSGFVGGHVILALLTAGHDVRATARDAARAGNARAAIVEAAGSDPGERLRFVSADLTDDAGWAEAVAGCRFVHHVASPFPTRVPKDESDLIVPARDGTLRVLRAARAAGVERVVLTSSVAAIAYGHPPRATPFDERDWTDLAGADTQPYMKSKTIAERAAWDFVAREGGPELAAVNPVAILGPVLGAPLSSSIRIVETMLTGEMPALPRIFFGVVDVRDVADLHLRAMIDPAAAGQRFLAQAGPSLSMDDVARTLRDRLGAAARKVPKRRLPDWLIRLAALVNADAASAVPHLGKDRPASADKARRLLGWSPRAAEAAILATAESLIARGLVRPG